MGRDGLVCITGRLREITHMIRLRGGGENGLSLGFSRKWLFAMVQLGPNAGRRCDGARLGRRSGLFERKVSKPRTESEPQCRLGEIRVAIKLRPGYRLKPDRRAG